MKFIDGFDHYSFSPTAKKKWDDLSSYLIQSPGRFGAGSKCRPSSSGNAFQLAWSGMTKTTNPTGTSKMIVGAAVRFDVNADQMAGLHPFLAFRGTDGKHQVQVYIQPGTGEIRAALANTSWPTGVASGIALTDYPPTYYASSGFIVPLGLWFYLEIEIASAGTVRIYADGELIQNLSGQTTMLGTSSGYTGVRWMGISTFNSGYDLDDCYIADGIGSHVIAPIGEVRIETNTTNSEGDTNDWIPSVGTNNAANVDGNSFFVENGDPPEYNRTDVLNAVDLYNHVDFTRDGTIYGVQVNLVSRKDDVGNRKVKPLLKTGGTIYEGTEAKLFSDYIYVGHIWPQNPNTTANWTRTQVNAVQTGIKISE